MLTRFSKQGDILKNTVCEPFTDASNIVQQLRERWNNRLSFPLAEVGKRYIESRIRVLLNCQCDERILPGGQLPTLSVSPNGSMKFRRIAGNRYIHRGNNQGQFPVLTEPVHIVDDKQRVIQRVRSFMGLEFLDEIDCPQMFHSTYFSFKIRNFVFRNGSFPQNGEGNRALVFGGLIGTVGKRPDNVIERRPEVVDNFSGQNAEPEGNPQLSVVLKCLLQSLVISIGDDWVFASVKEPIDFGLKIDDILVGPF